jgi:predicted HTH transcriptional regulator
LPTTFSICFHIRNNNTNYPVSAEGDFGINFGINETQKKIIALMRVNSQVTLGQIAGEVGVSKRQVESIISDLKSKGLIERVGARKNGRWIVKSSI